MSLIQQDLSQEGFIKNEFGQSQFGEDQLTFESLCPPEEYKKNKRCLIDNVEFSVLNSKRNCQFCGYQVCNSCSQKKREDPQNKGEFVRICDLCDEKFLRETIYQEDKEIERKIDEEIAQYERILSELNNDYKNIISLSQQNKNQIEESNQALNEQIEEQNQKQVQLQKKLKQIDQKLEQDEIEIKEYEAKLKDVREDIKTTQDQVDKLKKQDDEFQEKIKEYDSRIQELNSWLQSTNRDVSNWAISNKKFESFKKHRKNGQSSIWKEQPANTLDYNDNEIFRDLYSDSEDEDQLNSQKINNLLQDQQM